VGVLHRAAQRPAGGFGKSSRARLPRRGARTRLRRRHRRCEPAFHLSYAPRPPRPLPFPRLASASARLAAAALLSGAKDQGGRYCEGDMKFAVDTQLVRARQGRTSSAAGGGCCCCSCWPSAASAASAGGPAPQAARTAAHTAQQRPARASHPCWWSGPGPACSPHDDRGGCACGARGLGRLVACARRCRGPLPPPTAGRLAVAAERFEVRRPRCIGQLAQADAGRRRRRAGRLQQRRCKWCRAVPPLR
jgi:hypothetical protein